MEGLPEKPEIRPSMKVNRTCNPEPGRGSNPAKKGGYGPGAEGRCRNFSIKQPGRLDGVQEFPIYSE